MIQNMEMHKLALGYFFRSRSRSRSEQQGCYVWRARKQLEGRIEIESLLNVLDLPLTKAYLALPNFKHSTTVTLPILELIRAGESWSQVRERRIVTIS